MLILFLTAVVEELAMKKVIVINLFIILLSSCGGFDNSKNEENVEIMESLHQKRNPAEQKFMDSMKVENQEFWIDVPDINSAVDVTYTIGLDLATFHVNSLKQKDSLNLVAKKMSAHVFKNLMTDEMRAHIKEMRFNFGRIQYNRAIHFAPIVTFSKDSLLEWSKG